ncbi:MAG: hypothetical protein VYA44_06750 [SAR324 cluster bacterium]|nr:hypothetical protein [SAR324 cluster bacterium]
MTIPESQLCFGDSPSLANACLIPQVNIRLPFKYDLSAYTIIQAILDHRMKLETFKTTVPRNQLDSRAA